MFFLVLTLVAPSAAHAATLTVTNGQLRYITSVGGGLVSGRYPFVMDAAETFAVESVEFLDVTHPVHALRPADPLTVTFGFYSPSISFCYPGGEGPLGSEAGS